MDRPIYTKSGDDGTTGLLFGGRVSKNHVAPVAAGAIDELVAALGMIRTIGLDHQLEALVLDIQKQLFVVGAEVSVDPKNRSQLKSGETKVSSEMIERVEEEIDKWVSMFPLPAEFVIPGETSTGALFDNARGICRRAERSVVDAVEQGWLDTESLATAFLNRVSDLLFVLARGTEKGKFRPLHDAG